MQIWLKTWSHTQNQPMFFWNFDLTLSPPKFRLFTKMPSLFFLFFFENTYFTLSPSYSSSIHNIVIAINTLTTMNNQFEALNAPKIDLHFLFSQFLWNKNNISLLSLHIHPKKPKILILKFLWFIEALKVTILGGSHLFELLCAWRRLLCAK